MEIYYIHSVILNISDIKTMHKNPPSILQAGWSWNNSEKIDLFSLKKALPQTKKIWAGGDCQNKQV